MSTVSREMAAVSGAKEYVNALKAALVRGTGWKSEHLCEDVLRIAHFLRCMKLSPQLARCYLCIVYEDTTDFVLLKVEDAPHPSIPRLNRDRAIDLMDIFEGALLGNSSEWSHVPSLAFGKIQTLLYFREACDRLMQETGWTAYEDLPKLMANHAKRAGQSADKTDFTETLQVPKKDHLVELLLTQTAYTKPSHARIQAFLADRGMPATEEAVSDLLNRCIVCMTRRRSEALRGSALALDLSLQVE